jgi:CHASE3 domain sensor protein
MKNKLYLSLTIVAFLLCVVGLESYVQAQKISSAKQTWEYHVVDAYNGRDQIEGTLNQSGAQGWEYCGTNGNYYFFKRAK